MQTCNYISSCLEDTSGLLVGSPSFSGHNSKPTAAALARALPVLLVSLSQSPLGRADFLISTITCRLLESPSRAWAQYLLDAPS